MEIDKELLGAFFLSIFIFLLPLVTIMFFLVRWLIRSSVQWEIIISTILIVIAGILILANIALIIYISKDLIQELKVAFAIRKEEKEINNK